MNKYKYELTRFNGKECPSSRGVYGYRFYQSDDEDALPFSEQCANIIVACGKGDGAALALLRCVAQVLIVIDKDCDEEEYKDVNLGLQLLDKNSQDIRLPSVKTEEEAAAVLATRIVVSLVTKNGAVPHGIQNLVFCNHIDVSGLTAEQIDDKLMIILNTFNRANRAPSSMLLSEEVINNSDGTDIGDFLTTRLGGYARVIFSDSADPEKPEVRSIEL